MQKNVDIKNIDANLVLRAKKGDRDALSTLCGIAMHPVYYICVKILQNEADAEDITSETMITLIQKIQELKEPSAFYGWIKRIAVNKCNDYLSVHKPVLLGDEEDSFTDTELEDYNKEFLPEEFAIEKEKREILMEIIKTKTSKAEMMTLLMFYYNGDSIKNIAENMNCAEITVKKRLASARKKIKKGIEDKFGKGAILMAVVGLFVLSKAMEAEAAECQVSTDLIDKAISAAVTGAEVSDTNSFPNNIKEDVPTMVKGLSKGMIAAIAGAAVVVAGIVAAVVIAVNNNKKDDVTGMVTEEVSTTYEASDNKEDDTESKDENTDKEDETTVADDGEFVWPVKKVTVPDIPEMELKKEVVYTTEKGSVNINILQSFMTEDEFDRAATKEELKNNPLFKDLVFADIQIEDAEVEMYNDVGQLQKYKYKYQIGAAKEVDDDTEFFDDLTVSYEGNTADVNGYRIISLDIDTVNSENLTEDKIQYIYDAVKAVFGNKYADFLMYAPDEDGSILELEQENCIVSFSRVVSKNGLMFQIRIIRDNDSSIDSYSGDYEPIVGKAPYKIYEVFSNGIGSFDMLEYNKISSEMLVQFFENYKQTAPDYDGGYIYKQTVADNGHAVYEFKIDAHVATEEIGGAAAPKLEVEYTVIENAGKATEVEGWFRTGVAVLGQDIDVAAEKAKYIENAKTALRIILGDKAPETIEFDVNDLKVIEYKTNVLGLESDVYLGYEFGQIMAGVHHAYAIVEITS